MIDIFSYYDDVQPLIILEEVLIASYVIVGNSVDDLWFCQVAKRVVNKDLACFMVKIFVCNPKATNQANNKSNEQHKKHIG